MIHEKSESYVDTEVQVGETLLLGLIEAARETARQLAHEKGWPLNDMKAFILANRVAETMRR